MTVTMNYIDEIVTRISERLRLIRRLIADKFEVYGRIQRVMNDKTVVCMTQRQIDEYRRFASIYESEGKLIRKWLAELGGEMELMEVKWEIGKENTDYGMVYDNLKRIDDKQGIVINELEKIIAVGNLALAVL